MLIGIVFLNGLFELVQKNVDEAAEKLRGKGIDVFAVVCHVSNGQQRKDLIDKTVQVRFSSYQWLNHHVLGMWILSNFNRRLVLNLYLFSPDTSMLVII